MAQRCIISTVKADQYSRTDSVKIKARYDYKCAKCGSASNVQAHAPNGDHSDWRKGVALCGECHAAEHPSIPKNLFTNKVQQPYWPNVSARALADEFGCHNRTVIRVAKELNIPSGGPLSSENQERIRQRVTTHMSEERYARMVARRAEVIARGEARGSLRHECKRCGHRWTRRKVSSSPTCPKCKSPHWGEEGPARVSNKRVATKCPRCGSTDTRKRGWEILLNGRKQRRQCKSCGQFFFGRLQRREKGVGGNSSEQMDEGER